MQIVDAAEVAGAGAMEVAADAPGRSKEIAAATLEGVSDEAGEITSDVEIAIRMTSASIVENATKLGLSVTDAVAGSIEGARSASLKAGVASELAATAAYEGALEAAEKLGASTAQAVKDARNRG